MPSEPEAKELSDTLGAADEAHRSIDDPLIGIVLNKSFELKKLLGVGASGRVYLATHLILDRQVALKIIDSRLLQSEKAVQRFQNEASVLSSLDHPNLVKFLSFGVAEDGRIYLVTEYLEGLSLAQIILNEGALPLERALPIFRGICQGLIYAHEKQIVHRDIKPANVVILKADESETAKILDFGLFKSLEASDQKLTETGLLLGSVNYMSPEQCSAGKIDARSDIYSFACLMYECLVGNPPFDGETDLLIMQNQVNKPVLQIPAIHGISPGLSGIILRCLEKDPAKRFQSSEELYRALSAPSILSTKKLRKQFSWRIVISLGLSILLVVILVHWYQQSHRQIQNQVNQEIVRNGRGLKRPVIAEGAKLADVERWLTEYVESKNKSIQPIELAKAYVEARQQRLQLSIPGRVPCEKNVIARIDKALALEAKSDRGSESKSKRQLALLWALARVYASMDNQKGCSRTLVVINKLDPDGEKTGSITLGLSFGELGRLFALNGEHAIAFEMFENAIKWQKTGNDYKLIAFDLEQQAMSKLALGDLDGANECGKKAIVLIDTSQRESMPISPIIMCQLRTLNRLKPKDFARILKQSYFAKDDAWLDLLEKEPFVKDRIKAEKILCDLDLRLANSYRYMGEHAKSEQLVRTIIADKLLHILQKDPHLEVQSPLETEFYIDLLILKSPDTTKFLRSYLAKVKQIGPEKYLTNLTALGSVLIAYPGLFCHDRDEELNQALSEFELSKPGLCANLRLLRGQVLFNSGRAGQALPEFEKALENAEGNGDEFRLVASNGTLQSALQANNLKLAWKIVAQVQKDKSLPEASYMTRFILSDLCARLSFVSGSRNKALSLHEAMRKEHKDLPLNSLTAYGPFAENLAQEYQLLGQTDMAIDCLLETFESISKYQRSNTFELLRIIEDLRKLGTQYKRSDLLNLCDAKEKSVRKLHEFYFK